MLFLLPALAGQDVPAQQAVPVAAETRTVSRRLEIPNEIAPAVIPYMTCFIESIDAEVAAKGGADGNEMKRLVVVARQHCVSQRAEAKAGADRLLMQQGVASAAERDARIERTLVSIDGVYDSFGPASSSPSEH